MNKFELNRRLHSMVDPDSAGNNINPYYVPLTFEDIVNPVCIYCGGRSDKDQNSCSHCGAPK